jgi:hypothetical protein
VSEIRTEQLIDQADIGKLNDFLVAYDIVKHPFHLAKDDSTSLGLAQRIEQTQNFVHSSPFCPREIS